jgi:hypothetical protein
MVRAQLQHVILEIGERFGLTEFYVIGSAALLATIPNPPVGDLTATRDVDVIPLDATEQLLDQISFVLGEASDFDLEYGYYAQGVSMQTPRYAPAGWINRAIPVNVKDYTALCMDPADLVVAKLGAGRPEDLDFARAVAALKIVNEEILRQRLAEVVAPAGEMQLIQSRIKAIFRTNAT